MATVSSWIKAARLRTLPLATSGIIVGAGLAFFYERFHILTTLLALLTAILIQIFSNLANDYGDYQKGTDNYHRIGPVRTMQGGEITKKEMLVGMSFIALLCLILGFWLVFEATWKNSPVAFICFLLFGALSMLAAYFYTAGKRSYGYIGLGDIFVFLFFGILPVVGVYFLNSFQLRGYIILPAISVGLFSTGVLNLNNMRDTENDLHSGKITMAGRLGLRNSLIYHSLLILGGWISSVIFTFIQFNSAWQWLFLLSLPLFTYDLVQIWNTKQLKELDPFLKKLAITTLLFSILFSFGLTISK